MSVPPGAWRNAAPRSVPESARRNGQHAATGFGPANAVSERRIRQGARQFLHAGVLTRLMMRVGCPRATARLCHPYSTAPCILSLGLPPGSFKDWWERVDGGHDKRPD